jgi:hypothetical protein
MNIASTPRKTSPLRYREDLHRISLDIDNIPDFMADGEFAKYLDLITLNEGVPPKLADDDKYTSSISYAYLLILANSGKWQMALGLAEFLCMRFQNIMPIFNNQGQRVERRMSLSMRELAKPKKYWDIKLFSLWDSLKHMKDVGSLENACLKDMYPKICDIDHSAIRFGTVFHMFVQPSIFETDTEKFGSVLNSVTSLEIVSHPTDSNSYRPVDEFLAVYEGFSRYSKLKSLRLPSNGGGLSWSPNSQISYINTNALNAVRNSNQQTSHLICLHLLRYFSSKLRSLTVSFSEWKMLIYISLVFSRLKHLDIEFVGGPIPNTLDTLLTTFPNLESLNLYVPDGIGTDETSHLDSSPIINKTIKKLRLYIRYRDGTFSDLAITLNRIRVSLLGLEHLELVLEIRTHGTIKHLESSLYFSNCEDIILSIFKSIRSYSCSHYLIDHRLGVSTKLDLHGKRYLQIPLDDDPMDSRWTGTSRLLEITTAVYPEPNLQLCSFNDTLEHVKLTIDNHGYSQSPMYARNVFKLLILIVSNLRSLGLKTITITNMAPSELREFVSHTSEIDDVKLIYILPDENVADFPD